MNGNLDNTANKEILIINDAGIRRKFDFLLSFVFRHVPPHIRLIYRDMWHVIVFRTAD